MSGPPPPPLPPFDPSEHPFAFLPPPHGVGLSHEPDSPGALMHQGVPIIGKLNKRKRRSDDERPEPRRLKRTYESCARCRSKKIKCDNNSPRCKNCADANVDCQQEDRQNKSLKLRGHEELLQAQLNVCVALLQKREPYFDLSRLERFIEREGIYVSEEDAEALRKNAQLLSGLNPSPRNRSSRPTLAPSSSESPTEAKRPRLHMISPLNFYHPGHPWGVDVDPSEHPILPPPPPPPEWSPTNGLQFSTSKMLRGLDGEDSEGLRGQDPRMNDLSTGAAAARSLGVDKILNDPEFSGPPSAMIIDDDPRPLDGPGDDPALSRPIDGSQWLSRPFIKTGLSEAHGVYLPKNRTEVARLVDVYFGRLNKLRPVFSDRDEFDLRLREEYEIMDRYVSFGRLSRDSARTEDDPGFLCSFYLILALSRMADIASERQDARNADLFQFPVPQHFFYRAVNIKPELRVTISSLQALILLQWYLYTERHGRTLWRLVGNLVRLAVELGLHHDPSDSGGTFKPTEVQLRRQLWWIVMIQDRGTSVLLGRPLGISEDEFNTVDPDVVRDPNVYGASFDLGLPVTHIQAQIVTRLYRPGKLTGDELLAAATDINEQLVKMRNELPTEYHFYTRDTENWGDEQRQVLLSTINQEQGLTLLKYMIARILLLRTIFTSECVKVDFKRRALRDAVITSHNVLVIHSSLLQFTDCAFFVSPIPIHIAAMIILYARSNSELLGKNPPVPEHICREDVSMALRMIPQFRWRWGRRDAHGGHPLMNFLAEKVFGSASLQAFGPPNPPMLIPEHHFTEPDDSVPGSKSISPTDISPPGGRQNGHGSRQNIPALILGTTPSLAHGMHGAPLDPHVLTGDWRSTMVATYTQDPQIHLDEGAFDNYGLPPPWMGHPQPGMGTWTDMRLNEDWMPVPVGRATSLVAPVRVVTL